jgi:ketosteroid isomerase-like protein
MGVLMNDLYQINVAKAEFRAAYNSGSVDRLLAVFADEFTDMSAGVPSFFGTGAKSALRLRITKLLEQYQATLVVTIMAIRVWGNTAFDCGWHALTLAPKGGGEPITTRRRYCEIWKKNSFGQWKLDFYIDNMDLAAVMPNMDLPVAQVLSPPDTTRWRDQQVTNSSVEQ